MGSALGGYAAARSVCVMRFDLPEGTGTHNLIVDESGFVWIAGNRDAYIGRLDPRTGELKRYPIPDPADGAIRLLKGDHTPSAALRHCG